MRHKVQNTAAKRTAIMALAIVASGCQSAGQGAYNGYPNPYPPYNYSYTPGTQAAAPAQPAAAQPAVPGFDVAAFQELQSTNQGLKDRLDRVEKAMLRLDRRMQLVERNELNRMSGDQQTSQSGYAQQAAMNSLGMTGTTNDDDADTSNTKRSDYRPVSSKDESIDTVMVAPAGSPPPEPMRIASRGPVSNGLPSLADVDTGTGRALEPSSNSVAIWTVHYDGSNVWPDRDQLPSSREVVESLRQASGSGITITARGKSASSVQFRERVKALSRYLSKVSSLDSVPIAAMSAPHLDDETIEILATH